MNVEINVPAGSSRGYPVTIGRGLTGNCAELLAPVFSGKKIAVITDSNVAPLYMERVRASLERAGFIVIEYVFPAGEGSKNLSTLSDILEFLADNRLSRSDALVALGGGVVGDIAGFAAGCYMRGIKYSQIPTTLLACVDSSVGGKTAADLRAGKNLAGLFYPPQAVIIDPDCLSTLPDEVLSDGVAEVIKTGILDGEDLFSLAERGNIRENADEIIKKCVMYKAKIVAADEFERGERKLLNLGHTVGHAVETLSGYKVSHGHAVAIGTAIITRAAVKLGRCSDEVCARILAALRACGLPTATDFSADALADAAISDKKRSGDSITLVLPRGIGDCKLFETPVEELRGIIKPGL